ncbi:MAG: Lrp/AsnC family transcriptional regulator [archaeon]
MNKTKLAIDNTDVLIMSELIADAKLPLRELAKRTGVSFVTVLNRIGKLERQGVLKHYTAIIDYALLGYAIKALIQLRIAKGKLLELDKKLAKFHNIYEVYDITGDFDTVLVCRFRTVRELDTFVKTIQTYDFVERTNTILILNTIKELPMRI